MILAAPLVIPFAEAVGISIATLGMAKAADMVNDYIQENPEQSAMILKTLVPNLGIGEIFMKKGKDEEVEEEVSVEDIDPKDLTKEEKAKMMKELAKSGGGNMREKMKKGYEEIIQPGEDRTLVDAEERYDEGGVEDAPRPKFDYKKFFRNRRADGGAIGIEVLFEEKKPRKDFNTGGRATTQDFANALKSVSAGTTYQQQRQAKDYARQEASNLLSQAMRSGNQGNIQSILQGVGGITSIPGMQFNRSGNRITSVPATGAGRDAIINAMANQMLNTTSYGGGSSAPPQKSPLQLKIEENQRIYNEYVKNNPPAIGLLPGAQGGAPTIPKPEYEDKALLSQLTMLTPEEAFAGETFDTLSDLDQYNFAQAFTQYQPQLRDSSYVSPYGAPSGRQIFSRRYGIKDGGRVGLFMGGDPLTGQALSIYDSMKAYNFSDQEIANALSAQGLYTAPGSGTPDTTPGNTIGYQGGGGGGDNFSVYNPDPNSIRSIKQDPAIQSNLEAIQRNQQLQSMGIKDPFANEQDPANAYYGDMFEDTSNQIGKQSMFAKAKQGLSGIVGDVKGLMDSPIGNAIGFAINPIMGGIKGIASFANRMLPANERAIQENIMGNMGFAVNDIGQIVSTGDYDDPENVMAGYNLSRMTPETFMKRIASIKNRKAAQTDASRRRIAAIQEAQRKFEAAEKLKRLAVEEANLRKGRAPGGGRFDGGQAAYTNPDTGVGGGQFTDSLGNQDYQDAYDPGGGEKDGGIIGYRNGGLATMFKEKR